MKAEKSALNPSWRRGISQIVSAAANRVTKGVAKWAGYEAARPSRTHRQQNRYATNPNSTTAQIERVQMQWNAEWLAKNVPLGVGYLKRRVNYCSSGIHYTPDTGDATLNVELSSYLKEVWKNGGINCSMQESFSRCADVEQAVRGDATLIWYRDESQYRLMEAAADQIGELYQFTRPMKNVTSGLTYFAGMYFYPNGIRAGFKIYDRGYNQVYSNPRDFVAGDCIYFRDNLMMGIRGVTAFYGAIIMLTKSDALFGFGMDSAARQAKTAVVVFNEQGQPDEETYDSHVDESGDVVYAERNRDGAVIEYKFKGDSYQVVNAEAPGEELIEGCRYADERAALALGFPYSFLVNSRDVGGAPSRLEIGIAAKEIVRITERHESKLDQISYVSIMDAVDRGKFPPRANITRGKWHFPTLPTADAFRDTKDDIASLRAGIETRRRILGRYGETEDDVLRENTESAIQIAMAVQNANRRLVELGYEPTVNQVDIAQSVDNPQQQATAEAIDSGKGAPSVPGLKSNQASMSAYLGDVGMSDLPETTQEDIRKLLGANGASAGLRFVKYGMTAPELARKADPHNMETAQRHLRHYTIAGSADDVRSNPDKHVLMMNDRIVDGHHFLSKAIKGKISNSIPVLDLTPARFQLKDTES